MNNFICMIVAIVIIVLSFLLSILVGFITDLILKKEEVSFLASWLFSTISLGVVITILLYQNNYIG